MKKIFFVAALGIASILSAKAPIKKVTKKQLQQKTQKYSCVIFNLSCGGSDMACGETASGIIKSAWLIDSFMCDS